MIALSDPVTTGLVASLARPGGNITGQAIMDAEIAGKRVELLTEVVSGLRRVLLITYPADPTNPPQVRSFQAAARALRITLVIHEIRTPDDLPAAFATASTNGSVLRSSPPQPSSLIIGGASSTWPRLTRCR